MSEQPDSTVFPVVPGDAVPPQPRLPLAVPRSGLSDEARLALRQLLGDYGRALDLAFAQGADARVLAAARAALVARVVAHVWALHLGEPAGLALYAQGGFGRGRMFPFSDVDLLVLARAEAPLASRGLERVFAVLWDLGLKPAQAVRTLALQRQLAAEDLSVFTAAMEARWLAGDRGMQSLPGDMARDAGLWPMPRFLAGRLHEQARRREQRGGDSYRLEPDIKDGPGGLRHLDVLYWLGMRLGCPRDLHALPGVGLLDAGDADELAAAEALLARYRYALHMQAGRAEERLLFDHQRALARCLGYRDDDGALGVERFMQAYYRAAASVATLVDEASARLAARLEPPPAPQPLDADWQRRGVALEPCDIGLFARRPAALIEGALWLDAGAGIHAFSAECARAMRAALHAMPDATALAADAAALRAFDRLLQRAAEAPAAITALARVGVLGALIPAFATVSGRMQYDLFHVYTVDEHTLRVLAQLAVFAQPTARARFELAHALWAGQRALPVLLLAALFHDVAKGRGGDHSALGEAEVRAFAEKLQWSPAAVDAAAFLVRQHLLLSQTAQRQDIADPAVVQRFADCVGTLPRLEMLYLLTVADVIGTSASLWNGFKDRLFADLYQSTRRVLSGEDIPGDAGARAAACRAAALRLLAAQGHARTAVEALWQDFPEAAFARQRPEQAAWQSAALLAAAGALPVVAAQPDSVRGGLELFFLAADRDGLFAAVTAALEREGYTVQEARILGTPSGRALDSFVLLDAQGGPGSAERAAHLCARLEAALKAPRAPRARQALPRRLRHFQRAPRIRFEDSATPARTRLALRTSDRPGLLADVAEAFLASGVRVHDARVTTMGETADDYFELSDRHDRALDATRREALVRALEQRLGVDAPAAKTQADAAAPPSSVPQ
ncbi:[protein-PII] uridylyltransferase [Metallibacterium scheffleri]